MYLSRFSTACANANKIVSASSKESIAALLRSMARIRVRTTSGCKGLVKNSSAPEEIPAISFSIPCTLVSIRTGINCVFRFDLIRWQNSSPLISGIIRSRISRSTVS